MRQTSRQIDSEGGTHIVVPFSDVVKEVIINANIIKRYDNRSK